MYSLTEPHIVSSIGEQTHFASFVLGFVSIFLYLFVIVCNFPGSTLNKWIESVDTVAGSSTDANAAA